MNPNLPTFQINRRVLSIGAAVIVILVMAIVVWVGLTSRTPQMNGVKVRRGDISATASAPGKVRSRRVARLSLPQSGIVQNIAKMEGDDVNMGEVILSLRADETLRRVRQAELNLQSRQLDLARAKAAPRDEDIEISRANVRKATLVAAAAEAAYNSNPTAANDAARESARADLEIAKASFNRLTNGMSREELDALQNSVTIAQIELENTRAALAQTRVTAPFTATVTEVGVREGELVGGFSPLATITDLAALEIAADVDEIDVATVAVGQSVEVRLDAFPGEKFNGKLIRLSPAASTQRGSTVYTAVVEFDSRGLQVRVGMGANLKIQTAEKKNVLLVPNRALKNVGTRKAVHVLAPGEQRDVIVETGVTDGNDTEIVSGLSEVDQVSLQ